MGHDDDRIAHTFEQEQLPPFSHSRRASAGAEVKARVLSSHGLEQVQGWVSIVMFAHGLPGGFMPMMRGGLSNRCRRRR
jgi:hypothetical protein